jgi:uncharacterized phiE125 gp8 family phage protein
MLSAGPAEAIVTLTEAQAYARVESGSEEALLAGLVRTASALCEAFLGQIVIARPFSESVQASSEWRRLEVVPVRTIDSASSGGIALAVAAYATDIDSSGQGWFRVTSGSISGVVTVSGSAGMALEQNGVPEPIRQGVLRLVAHLFTGRDGDGGEVPAAVTALWRPYRRMRLG